MKAALVREVDTVKKNEGDKAARLLSDVETRGKSSRV